MTVPVSMDNVIIDEETMEKEMSFYIDAKNQENPPKPNNPALYISTRPEMTVYTRYTWDLRLDLVNLDLVIYSI